MTKKRIWRKSQNQRVTVSSQPFWPGTGHFETTASNRLLLDHLAANMLP